MRTLVVRLGALGDAVLTLPAVAHLLGDGDEVTVLGVPASWAFLPEASPLRIEDADAARWRALFSGETPAAARGFDRAFVMLGNRLGAVDALRGAIRKATHVPPLRPGEAGEHAAWRLLRGVGGDRLDSDAVRRLLPAASGERHDLVLHPGSGGRRKRWPADRFAALARRADRPLILLGPAEDDLPAAFVGLPVARSWPLRRIAGVLANAGRFLGNDSGVTHLASYLCPTLALFGPTDPRVWAPAGPHVRVVEAPAGDLDALAVDAVAGLLA
jgi:heptosyltransferase III